MSVRSRSRAVRASALFGVCASALCILFAVPHAAAQTTTYQLGEGRSWQALPQDPAGPDEQLIREVRRLLAEDRPEAALELADAWFTEHEDDDEAAPAELYLLRGDALLLLDQEYEALFDYERVVTLAPGSELFVSALEREFEIARLYMRGLKRRFLGMRIISAHDLGVELIIRVQERLPGSRLAERSNIFLADYYYDRRQMGLARDSYEVYLANYPEGEHRMTALKRLIFADLSQFKGPRYDSSSLIDARLRARDFAEEFPVEAENTNIGRGLDVRIEESLAAQLLENLDWYLRRNDEPSARYVLGRLLSAYPDTAAAEAGRRTAQQRNWDLSLLSSAAIDERADRDDEPFQIEGELEGEVVIEPPPGDAQPAPNTRPVDPADDPGPDTDAVPGEEPDE